MRRDITRECRVWPRLAGERRVKGDDELAGVMNGVGGKVEGHTMKAVVISKSACG